jgi:hypothetical protein
MRNSLAIMHEDTASPEQRIQQEHNGRRKPRLQMRYLLASGPAQTRQNVAQLLGVHRHTIGHWHAIDAKWPRAYRASTLQARMSDVYLVEAINALTS